MKVHLICSDNINAIVIELLGNRKIELDDTSEFCVIEKGFSLPTGKIGLYFEMSTLSLLMTFLDQIAYKEEENSKVITGKHKDGYEIITYDRIHYFEGFGNDVYCVTLEEKYRVKEKLYEIEERLKREGFIRVSKAHIVNIARVSKVVPWFNGKLLLRMEESDQEIDVTRRYVKEFKQFLGI